MDEHVGIDYSLLSDPVVTWDTLDMDFKVSPGGSCSPPQHLPTRANGATALHAAGAGLTRSLPPRACSSTRRPRTRRW